MFFKIISKYKNMKNQTLILSIILFISVFFPIYSFAMIPGWGGSLAQQEDSGYNCIVWREGMTSTYNLCKRDIETPKRLYEAEVAIQALESKIDELERKNDEFNSRIQALENRTSIVDQTIEKLQKNIMDSLRSILLLIISKNNK